MDLAEQVFVEVFGIMQKRAHDSAFVHGFWQEPDQRNSAAKIALMHSELSEALEALRYGDQADDKLPQFKGVEAELADCIIRIMDFAGYNGLRVAEAIVAKMEHNRGRELLHGKKF